MDSLLRRRPRHATIVAYLALFVALGGSSYAALRVGSAQIVNNSVRTKDLRNNDVRGKDVRNNTLTGADINEARLGTVPSANTANSAATATNATNASALQGYGPDAFAPSSIESARVVGAPGEPPYTNGWAAIGTSEGGVSFYKDSYGIVHLQGNATHSGASATSVFTLPAAYRPAVDLFFPGYGPAGVVSIDVEPNGAVTVFPTATTYIGLSSISFRVGVTGLP